MASGQTIPNSQRTKDKDAVQDFVLDWSKELASASDTIATSTWTVPTGITLASSSNTTTTATAWLSGGTLGAKYIVTNRIVTAGGRSEDASIEITIIDGSAAALDHYCTLDDVNKLVPQVPFTDTSKPNAATVLGFIEAVAKRIDATLGNLGYTVPVVSGTQALDLLREACAWGALGLAQQVRDTGVKTAVTESGRPMKNIWLQMFEDWLKRLADGEDPFELPDAPRTGLAVEKQSADLASSFVSDGAIADFDGDDPTITRAQVF